MAGAAAVAIGVSAGPAAASTHGTGGGLVNVHWNTAKLIQSGFIHTVAGPIHSFVGPPPHSAFLDKWV